MEVKMSESGKDGCCCGGSGVDNGNATAREIVPAPATEAPGTQSKAVASEMLESVPRTDKRSGQRPSDRRAEQCCCRC